MPSTDRRWLLVLVSLLALPWLTPQWWLVTPERVNAALTFFHRLALTGWLLLLTVSAARIARANSRLRSLTIALLVVGFFLLPPLASGDSFGATARSLGVPISADPYLVLPSGPVAQTWLLAPSWNALPTPYGPLWHALPSWFFSLTGWLPSAALLLRLVSLLAAVGGIFLLRVLVGGRARQLFPLAPLALFETANNGHPDSIIVLCLLVACLFATDRWRIISAAALVVAAAVKPPALLAAPAFVLTGTRQQRIATACLLLVGVTAVYLPFVLDGGVFSMLRIFSRVVVGSELTPLGALLWPALSQWLSPSWLLLVLRWLGFTLTGLFSALAFRRTTALAERAFLTIAFAFLFIPSGFLQPWYLLWLIPLAGLLRAAWQQAILVALISAWLTSYVLMSTSIGFSAGSLVFLLLLARSDAGRCRFHGLVPVHHAS